MDPKWSEMTVSALKQKCEERGLPKSGIKADILNRLREHEEKFRPQEQRQLDHGPRFSQDDIQNVRGFEGIMHRLHRRPEGNVRRDQEQSGGTRAESIGKLTEDELERILRENYLPWESDPTGRDRHSTIIAEYNVKHEEARNKRDGTITKAETKYKNDAAKLEKDRDEKLDQLQKEVAPKLEQRKNWGPAFRELEMLRKARGVGPPTPSSFAPRYQRMNATSPPLPSRPQASNNMFIASSFNTAPSSLSSGLKRKASNTTLPSSFTDPPSLRLHDMEDPFVETPRGSNVDMVVESKSIKNQLVDNPYIFLAAGNIWLQRGSLQRMKTMIESAHFSPKHVRADQTGYFIVFESSAQGDSQAALCFEHFQGKLFNGNLMRMELHRRDRRDR